MLSEIEQLLL